MPITEPNCCHRNQKGNYGIFGVGRLVVGLPLQVGGWFIRKWLSFEIILVINGINFIFVYRWVRAKWQGTINPRKSDYSCFNSSKGLSTVIIYSTSKCSIVYFAPQLSG